MIRIPHVALGALLATVVWAACTGGQATDAASQGGRPQAAAPGVEAARPAQAPARANAAPRIPLRVHQILDEQHGGLAVATMTVPRDWKVTSRVVWNYQDVSHPVRAMARAESADGSAWVEYFPIEIFYWLEPVRSPVAMGGRNLGMIHAPGIRIQDALQHFVVGPYRGRMQNLQVVRSRPVRGLPQAFGLPAAAGDGMAVRLRYDAGGRVADEDVYAMLGSGERIPYTGPQGTWYESHRPLVFAHAIGATGGKLDSMYPLLGFIASSLKVDPAWEAHRQKVVQQLAEQFNQMIAAGYAQIQAAAQLSRTISANNDAMLASMQAQRQAQAQRDAQVRAASGGAVRDPSDEFSQYIRGTERMQDPYWGESEQSYTQRYHWTDGQGNYQSSNDPSFNPNIGAGGGPSWQRMDPVRER